MLTQVHASRSRLSAAITLLFLVGGAVVVVLAVVAVARDVRDDAAWAAVVLGVALVGWGVWFHRLGVDVAEESGPRATEPGTPATPATLAGAPGDAAAEQSHPAATADPVGTAAVAGVIAAGGYWLVRGPLDRGVAESAVVAAIAFGLWLLNRSLDARIRRRRAGGGDVVG